MGGGGGYCVCPYLDDWLIRSWSRLHVVSSVCIIWSTFNMLSLLIKTDKSVLSLILKIKFIGVVLDSTMVKALLPQMSFLALQSLFLDLKAYPLSMVRLLGHLAVCAYVVHYSRQCFRSL